MNTELKKELQALKERIAELEKECEAVSFSRTWENVAIGKEGWCISLSGHINYNIIASKDDRSTFPTREHAEAVFAEAQLMWLRDHYRNGWKPEMGEYASIVCLGACEMVTEIVIKRLPFFSDCSDLFAFQDKATAERFLNEQRPLLETYFKKFSL
jgi:hypothetical protein